MQPSALQVEKQQQQKQNHSSSSSNSRRKVRANGHREGSTQAAAAAGPFGGLTHIGTAGRDLRAVHAAPLLPYIQRGLTLCILVSHRLRWQ